MAKPHGLPVETCMLVKPAIGGDPYEKFLATLPELVPCTSRADAMKGRPHPRTVAELGHLPEFQESPLLPIVRNAIRIAAEEKLVRARLRRSWRKGTRLAKRPLPLKPKKENP